MIIDLTVKVNDKIVNLYSLINKINSKSDEKLSIVNYLNIYILF